MLKRLTQKLRSFRRAEKGAASVELVIVFPVFFSIFVSSFELAMMNIRAVMVERATDIVVRDIRLMGGGSIEYNDVRAAVCATAGLIDNCLESIRIEMQPVDLSNWVILSTEMDCIRREEALQPIVNFENGQENELMLIRVCAIQDPFFPTFGVGRSMPKDETGGYIVSASSAFVNEPS